MARGYGSHHPRAQGHTHAVRGTHGAGAANDHLQEEEKPSGARRKMMTGSSSSIPQTLPSRMRLRAHLAGPGISAPLQRLPATPASSRARLS